MIKNDIGLIGLAVMGQNLALNIARRPIMTLTAQPGCRRTCSRPNGIISGPTPTGARTKREYSIHNGSSLK